MDRGAVGMHEVSTQITEHADSADGLEHTVALARRLADRLAGARRRARNSHDLRLAQSLALHVVELLEASVKR